MPADGDTPKYAVSPLVPPVAALALIVILDRLAPVPFLPQPVSLAVGIPLLALGLGLWAWGVSGLLRRARARTRGRQPLNWSPADRSGSAGDPIYTGGTAALLGLALLLDTATGAAIVVALALVAHNLTLAVRPEAMPVALVLGIPMGFFVTKRMQRDGIFVPPHPIVHPELKSGFASSGTLKIRQRA